MTIGKTLQPRVHVDNMCVKRNCGGSRHQGYRQLNNLRDSKTKMRQGKEELDKDKEIFPKIKRIHRNRRNN